MGVQVLHGLQLSPLSSADINTTTSIDIDTCGGRRSNVYTAVGAARTAALSTAVG